MAESKPIDYASFLYAYALGSLDKEDLISLLEYFEAGKDYPWQELGEFQNLTSLLPSFLNIEDPPAGLKDRVARKLYRMRESKPPVKKATMITPPQATGGSSRTKTSLREKMKVTSTDQGTTAAKTFSPPASARMSDEEIVTPPEFKSASPFSQRSGLGARPQQDTQVRSRQQQEAPLDRSAMSAEQERPELLSQVTDDDSHFRKSAPEEFLRDSGFEKSPAQAPVADESADSGMHLNLGGFGNRADQPQTFEPPHFAEEPAESEEVFEFNEPEETEAEKSEREKRAHAANLEEIRKQVVSNVEKEAVAEPVIPQEKPKAAPPLILYIMPILIIIGVALAYYMLNMKIKNLQNGTAKGEQYVTKTELEKLKENTSPRWSAEVLALLLKKDSKSVLLSGTGKYASSYGKLIYDAKTSEGFVALAFLPLPPQDTKYYLWMLEGKNATLVEFKEMLSFSPETLNYTPVAKVPAAGAKKAMFLLTIEKIGAVPAQPSQQRCLEGLAQ